MENLEQLNLELVSPEKLVISKSVDMVVISGTEGDFGVLPGHAPIVSSIRPGVLEIYENNNIEKLFLAEGFVEVLQDRVSILASEISKIEDISVSECEKKIELLRDKIKTSDDDIEKDFLAREINKFEVKIEISKS